MTHRRRRPSRPARPPAGTGFPDGFVWGAAAAAYQIEGATRADGRGESVWDVFCRRPGAVFSGHTGDVACDHYHRWREDVALMRSLGLSGYRFSISWTRVLPEGRGRVNPKGLGFYDRLVDGLLAAGIVPYVTLFHWDYPQALYLHGGWLNPDSPAWFADYARTVVRALGDRVRHWITQNEIQCFIGLGHKDGVHAPGDRLDWPQVLQAGHHAMLAHGDAVRAIRAASRGRCFVGAAPVGACRIPATESAPDVAAARRATFAVTERSYWNASWWLEPILAGRYPEDGLRTFGSAAPQATRRDLDRMCQPLDFFGCNLYQAGIVRAGRRGAPEPVGYPVGHPHTAMRWPVTPTCLYWGPRFFWERYRLPIVVTENGCANADWIARDGAVRDPQRIDYLGRHLAELRRAIRDGVKVSGYFVWSILDNFEWAEGYRERFGIVYVDYPTQRRIPKDSARWYAAVARSNGATLDRTS